MTSDNSPADEIRKLKNLLDEGVISQEEFAAQKASLLSKQNQGAFQPNMQQTQYQNVPLQPSGFTPKEVKKKKHTGIKIFLFVIISVLVLCIMVSVLASIVGPTKGSSETGNTSTASQAAEKSTPEAYLKFDDRTWGDFVTLYKSHNALMQSIDAYGKGTVLSTDFYLKCEEAEQYFAKASLSFEYGTTTEEKEYLSSFKAFALSDQLVAKSLIKYLDSNKESDLAKVKTNIEEATQAAGTIASNRGILLVKAGLTDAEIKEKVEEDMKELDEE